MDLKQLQYFVAIVDQLSYSKAAQKLHISQPSLSNAIKNLEREVGSVLLERSTRKIELTDAGKILYKKSIQLLSSLEIVKKEMEEVKLVGSGELVIGMIESVKTWITKVIRDYHDQFPNIHFTLNEVLSGKDVKESLRKYNAHAIITNQHIYEEDIESIPLYKERLVLVLHQDHPLSEKETLSLKDLKREPFIISTSGFQTREDILNAFRLDNITPTIKFEMERFETAMSLVRENLGVTIIPENYLLGPKEDVIVIKPIDSPALERTVYLTFMKNRYLSPAIQIFLESIQQYCRKGDSDD